MPPDYSPPGHPLTDVLGDALIPVINKLQDIFSQVRRLLRRGAWVEQGCRGGVPPACRDGVHAWAGWCLEGCSCVPPACARCCGQQAPCACSACVHACSLQTWLLTCSGLNTAQMHCLGALQQPQVTVDLKLNLPQVAVIGSQSSGKSSVLEALVRTALRCPRAMTGRWDFSGSAPDLTRSVIELTWPATLASMGDAGSAGFAAGPHLSLDLACPIHPYWADAWAGELPAAASGAGPKPDKRPAWLAREGGPACSPA